MDKWTISNVEYESDIINPKLAVSPWCGHRNFIYDFLNYIKPEKIIELGTHYGCSFFAMCQSIKDNRLNCELYAVDTWRGDEQAGFYGNEVWEVVNQTGETYYSTVDAKLLRMTFDEAAKTFADDTFDLIHIDGLHTYDAVSGDYAAWLPKLKKNGVMLFHDVNSELNYGTNQFWREIKNKYKFYFEFEHSWGLGILFPKGNRIYDKMLEQNFCDKILIYNYKALYQYETIKTEDLTQMANERYDAINHQSKMIDERDATIETQTKMIDERDATIKGQNDLIDERDATIRSQTKMIDERDATIKGQNDLIDERDVTIRSQTKMIDERDTTIKNQNQIIENQLNMLSERDSTISNQLENSQKQQMEIQQLREVIDSCWITRKRMKKVEESGSGI